MSLLKSTSKVLILLFIGVLIVQIHLFKSSVQKVLGEIRNVNSFPKCLQLHYKELDIKSEYLFRKCSVATDLVTSHQIHSNLCYYAVLFLANYVTSPYSIFFTPIAALLQAVLQANAEPSGIGVVETRNSKSSRNLTTCQIGPKWWRKMDLGQETWILY